VVLGTVKWCVKMFLSFQKRFRIQPPKEKDHGKNEKKRLRAKVVCWYRARSACGCLWILARLDKTLVRCCYAKHATCWGREAAASSSKAATAA